MRAPKALTLAAFSLAVSACGTLDLRQGNSAQTVDYRFGFTRILRNDSAKTGEAVHDTTLGLWLNAEHSGVGWRDQRLAIIPRECRVVILADNPDRLAAAERLAHLMIADGEQACAKSF